MQKLHINVLVLGLLYLCITHCSCMQNSFAEPSHMDNAQEGHHTAQHSQLPSHDAQNHPESHFVQEQNPAPKEIGVLVDIYLNNPYRVGMPYLPVNVYDAADAAIIEAGDGRLVFKCVTDVHGFCSGSLTSSASKFIAVVTMENDHVKIIPRLLDDTLQMAEVFELNAYGYPDSLVIAISENGGERITEELPASVQEQIKNVFAIFASITHVAEWTASRLMVKTGQLTVIYVDKGTGFSDTFGVLVVAKNDFPGMTLAHEYGHFVMYRLFDNVLPSNPTTHTVCKIIDMSVAWTEGYADAFAIIYTAEKYKWGDEAIGVYQVSDEKNLTVEYYFCDIPNAQNDEVRIAALLWDLYDKHDDDNGGYDTRGRTGYTDANKGDSLTPHEVLVRPLRNTGTPATLGSYWSILRTQLPPNKLLYATAIYNYNYGPPGF